MHSKSALTRFANSHIHQNVDEESADVFLTIHKDGKTISRSKNITGIKSSKEFVKEAPCDIPLLGFVLKWQANPVTVPLLGRVLKCV